MDDIVLTRDTLVYPKAKDRSPVVVDVKSINLALSRIQEIAFITKAKAPELLASFNDAFKDLTTIVGLIRLERDRAKALVDIRHSTIVVDESNEILRVKGIKESATMREALVPLDLEYQALKDLEAKLNAIVKILEGQLLSLELACQSAKKIYSDQMSYGSYLNASTNEN